MFHFLFRLGKEKGNYPTSAPPSPCCPSWGRWRQRAGGCGEPPAAAPARTSAPGRTSPAPRRCSTGRRGTRTPPSPSSASRRRPGGRRWRGTNSGGCEPRVGRQSGREEQVSSTAHQKYKSNNLLSVLEELKVGKTLWWGDTTSHNIFSSKILYLILNHQKILQQSI